MKKELRNELLADAKRHLDEYSIFKHGYLAAYVAAECSAIDDAMRVIDKYSNFLDGEDPIMTTPIGPLPINSTGMRKLADACNAYKQLVAQYEKAILSMGDIVATISLPRY